MMYAFLMLTGCNESPSATKANDSDSIASSTSTDTTSMPAYDPAMDSYNVGGEFIQKIADTLNIKMYFFTIKPNDSAALHAHPDHIVYIIQGGKLRVTFRGQGTQTMDVKPGMAFVSGPVFDAGRNIGNTTVKMLIADIYRPRNK